MLEIKCFIIFAIDILMKRLCRIVMLLAMLISTESIAQKRNEAGVVLGGGYYLGELNPGCQFLNTKPTFGAFYRRNFNDRVSLRVAANYTTFAGNDTVNKIFTSSPAGLYSRKGHFTSTIADVNLMSEINFLKYFIGASRNRWTPYIIAGIGASYQISLEGGFIGEDGSEYITDMTGVKLVNDTAGYVFNKPGNISLNVNFGLGVKYSVTDRVGLFAEWVMNKTFVDWMDGFYYIEGNEELSNGAAGGNFNYNKINAQHICNTATKDWYSYLQIGISFAFNMTNKNDCLDHLR